MGSALCAAGRRAIAVFKTLPWKIAALAHRSGRVAREIDPLVPRNCTILKANNGCVGGGYGGGGTPICSVSPRALALFSQSRSVVPAYCGQPPRDDSIVSRFMAIFCKVLLAAIARPVQTNTEAPRQASAADEGSLKSSHIWDEMAAGWRCTANELPRPTSLSTEIVPPCLSTICLVRERPSPAPPSVRARTLSARQKRSKT